MTCLFRFCVFVNWLSPWQITLNSSLTLLISNISSVRLEFVKLVFWNVCWDCQQYINTLLHFKVVVLLCLSKFSSNSELCPSWRSLLLFNMMSWFTRSLRPITVLMSQLSLFKQIVSLWYIHTIEFKTNTQKRYWMTPATMNTHYRHLIFIYLIYLNYVWAQR